MKHGFTIIELLVVAVIIAILISFLLPAVHRARESAKDGACKHNLKNIHSAIAIYALNNDDLLPPKYELKKITLSQKDISEGKRLNTVEEGIQTVLSRYAQPGLFRCPADRGSYGNAVPVWKRRGDSYEVKGGKWNMYGVSLEETEFWSKLSKNAEIASDPFRPWEADDPAKVAEKMSKGEMGPINWHPGWYNLLVAHGGVYTVYTKDDANRIMEKIAE